ncbi:MAG: hypothetical protein AAGF11_38015 [Myxococcota bacterium]
MSRRSELSCVLFGVAQLLHSYASWQRYDGPLGLETALTPVSLLLALVLVWRPHGVWLVGLALSSGLEVLSLMPHVRGHHYVLGFVDLAIMSAFAQVALRERAWHVDIDRLVDSLTPLVLIVLCATFFFAGFSKLNTLHFTDASEADGLARLFFALWAIPHADWMVLPFRLGGPLELLIVGLVAMRRTRHWGMLLAALMLLLFALSGPIQHAIILYACMIPCLDERFVERLCFPRQLGGERTKAAQKLLVCAIILLPKPRIFAHVALADGRTSVAFDYVLAVGALVYVCIALWILGRAIRGLRPRSAAFARIDWRRPSTIVVAGSLLTTIVVLEAGVYVGYRTRPRIAMFSNLGSKCTIANHYLWPSALAGSRFRLASDLVIVDGHTMRRLHPLRSVRADRHYYFSRADLPHALRYREKWKFRPFFHIDPWRQGDPVPRSGRLEEARYHDELTRLSYFINGSWTVVEDDELRTMPEPGLLDTLRYKLFYQAHDMVGGPTLGCAPTHTLPRLPMR